MEPEHESGDLLDNRNAVVFAALGLVLFVVACVGAAWLMKWVLGPDPGERYGAPGMVQPGGTPMPSDEVTEGRLAAEASWAARAGAWEWVDVAAGVARIPVDRAAQILLERGFPTRAEAGQPVAMRGDP